jgi:hypothetical protein
LKEWPRTERGRYTIAMARYHRLGHARPVPLALHISGTNGRTGRCSRENRDDATKSQEDFEVLKEAMGCVIKKLREVEAASLLEKARVAKLCTKLQPAQKPRKNSKVRTYLSRPVAHFPQNKTAAFAPHNMVDRW